jgi:hypoxanthine phosphoribosyltransferase
MTRPPPNNFSWSQVDQLSRKVSLAVQDAGYHADVVLGIARGGLTPAVHISHLLNIRSFRTAIVESTTDDSPYAARLARPRIVSDLNADIVRGRNLLVVDDAISTGVTVQAVLEFIRPFGPYEMRVAILVQDTAVDAEELARADAVIDFLGTRVNGWALFPWTA